MNEANKKYAVVTGASSGIGWYISGELAKKGYSLVAVSNQPELLAKLKFEFEQEYQIQVLTINIDLTKNESPQKVFNFCQENNLSIEVLVNNAGILVYGEVTSIELKRTEDILYLHMNTPVMLCRLFGEVMVHNQKGYILNVSSISAVMPYPLISLYGPTKAFLRHFSKALHIEMKRTNVHVTCLLPGATATTLHDKDKVNLSLAMKLGVMEKPEFVAKTGVTAMFTKKRECIPGILNKFTVLFLPFLPTFIIQLIYKRYLRRAKV
jgi:short-subunit dehydrogenase